MCRYHAETHIRYNVQVFYMSDSNENPGAFTGVGRWLTVASELPCSVIVFLFAGQLVGQQIWGDQGAITGALIGVILGFVIGIYSVFITIRRFEQIEAESLERNRKYMPPAEEIFEEYDWSSKKTND